MHRGERAWRGTVRILIGAESHACAHSARRLRRILREGEGREGGCGGGGTKELAERAAGECVHDFLLREIYVRKAAASRRTPKGAATRRADRGTARGGSRGRRGPACAGS